MLRGSNLINRCRSNPVRRCPSALTSHCSHAARCAAGAPGARSWERSIRSSTPASDTTTFCGSDASICVISVDPQRDRWKINPAGFNPGLASCHSASAPIGVRKRNRLLNGVCTSKFAVVSKNGSLNRLAPR